MSKHPISFWWSSKGLAALGLIGAASYFLLIEHREHVLPFLPYLILLACPLMHLLMHGGHGHHHSRETQSDGSSNSPHHSQRKNQKQIPQERGGNGHNKENDNAW